MAKGDISCPRWHGFESWRRIPKINKKTPGLAHFYFVNRLDMSNLQTSGSLSSNTVGMIQGNKRRIVSQIRYIFIFVKGKRCNLAQLNRFFVIHLMQNKTTIQETQCLQNSLELAILILIVSRIVL